MTRYGFHASHEQISPRQLLADVQHAEQAGFDIAMCSDHYSPWSERQGHSGYAWSWLGAALATTSLRLGCVSAPGLPVTVSDRCVRNPPPRPRVPRGRWVDPAHDQEGRP